MNKEELLQAMKDKVEGGSKAQAEKYFKAFEEVVIEAMVKGEDIKLVGFGTFEVKATKERQVPVNPAKPELGKKTLPASRVPKFKFGKPVIESVKEATK